MENIGLFCKLMGMIKLFCKKMRIGLFCGKMEKIGLFCKLMGMIKALL